MEHYYAVIMAGGGGTRLWPLSRKSKPKQTLRLFGERSLFQNAVDRLLPLIPKERIFVVTIEEQAKILQEQSPQIANDQFILEPLPKGTASVVGIAATLLNERDPESVMAVVTSDHYIGNVQQFHRILSSAYDAACSGALVTLGVQPSYASTGYGYIHRGKQIREFNQTPVYQVQSFKEKPSREIAEKYIASGDYLWNSGMFIWKTGRILSEINRQMPGLSNGLEKIRSRIGKSDYTNVFSKVWNELIKETIDYGVMENASDVQVIPAGDMQWFDIGGWDRYFDLMEPDREGNLILGDECILIDSKNSMIYQEPGLPSKRLIAVLGMDEMIIVDTHNVIMICPRERVEEIKSFIEALSRTGREKYL